MCAHACADETTCVCVYALWFGACEGSNGNMLLVGSKDGSKQVQGKTRGLCNVANIVCNIIAHSSRNPSCTPPLVLLLLLLHLLVLRVLLAEHPGSYVTVSVFLPCSAENMPHDTRDDGTVLLFFFWPAVQQVATQANSLSLSLSLSLSRDLVLEHG